MPKQFKKNYSKKNIERKQAEGKNLKRIEKRLTRLEHDDELKYEVQGHTGAFSGGTTLIHALSTLGQGDNVEQRVGEEVTAKYLNCTWRFAHLPGIVPEQMRIIVFWDLQNNGGAPSITGGTPVDNLLDTSISPASPMVMPHNYRTKDRYKILYDKYMYINLVEPTVNQLILKRKSFKLGNAKVKYSDSGATNTSMPSRALYCVLLNTAATTAVFDINYTFWFTDA